MQLNPIRHEGLLNYIYGIDHTTPGLMGTRARLAGGDKLLLSDDVVSSFVACQIDCDQSQGSGVNIRKKRYYEERLINVK